METYRFTRQWVLDEVIKDTCTILYIHETGWCTVRLLPFTDSKGDVVIARPIAFHRRYGYWLGLCRQTGFGRPCLFCQMNTTRAFSRPLHKYAVNIKNLYERVKGCRWVHIAIVPPPVFDQISDYLLQGHLDAIDYRRGRRFFIQHTGHGTQGRYSVEVSEWAIPVDKWTVNHIQDPLVALKVPSYKSQQDTLKELFSCIR